MRQRAHFPAYTYLLCHKCHKHLYLQISFRSTINEHTVSGIAQCKCNQYPVLAGIVYLYDRPDKKAVLSSIARRNEVFALFSLIESPRRIKILVCLTLVTHFFCQKLGFISQPLKKTLGFFRFLSVLQLEGFSNAWSVYLINRSRMPSYILSVFASNIIQRGDIAIDIGCGAGHLLPVMANKTDPRYIYGIDKSFLNLLMARIFYANPQSTLVCGDVEKSIPFEKHAVNVSISADCFHNIRKQKKFLDDVSLITGSTGSIALIHILNNKNWLHGNVHGLSPTQIRQHLKQSHFSQIIELSNQSFWHRSQNCPKTSFSSSDPLSMLLNSYAFSVIATRERGKLSSISTPKKYKNLIQKNIYWRLDKPLQEYAAIEMLSARYDTFLFISPHLDDAVLSCESLIKTLLSHNKTIFVISVFTQSSPPPYTNQAKYFMGVCGYNNADTLFNDRKEEDIRALSSLGCKHIHLHYVDAAWRKITDLTPVYPNEKAQFSGRISHQDDPIVDQIQNDVMSLYKKCGNPLLLAPLGIGGHCDHTLIHKMIANMHLPSLFWEDYPYNAIGNDLQTYMQKHKDLNLILESKRADKSRSALKFYKTYSLQNKHLFPLGTPEHVPERYYSLANNIHDQPI